jgi:hypothetical protein
VYFTTGSAIRTLPNNWVEQIPLQAPAVLDEEVAAWVQEACLVGSQQNDT